MVAVYRNMDGHDQVVVVLDAANGLSTAPALVVGHAYRLT
jgi:hypothetical protein